MENIVLENGPEFISNAMDEWAYSREVKLHFIRASKPVDNAFMESFNMRFRDECLNLNWFRSNETRPHSPLDFRIPKEFAQKEAEDFTEKL
ncbi:transposase [candidate division WS5 bacterium]|uniref:Transposase n=1 Tax=candidate division WS5 bacterium TaxID=2093353 RepID=A0A419DA35_9BACT|nr:MAG: transposase [candidate division WS5 bacterium]